MIVGLPRSLGFFYLFPLYRTFLSRLGLTWVESDGTGSLDLCPTDEPCISVKASFAHCQELLGKTDCLFVPAVVSLSHTNFCCPKMIGLPSMLRAGLDLDRDQLISPVIDFKENPIGWKKTWVYAAEKLGVCDKGKAIWAVNEGLKAWDAVKRRAADTSTPMSRFIHGDLKTLNRKCSTAKVENSETLPTGIVGHSYILHDVFGENIIRLAQTYGPIIMPECVSSSEISQGLDAIPDGHKLWAIEGDILGAAIYLLRQRKIGRIVFVSAFSCGPLSIIENYISQEAEAYGVPFLSLAIDEHYGEAGLVTRLEAFMDAVVSKAADTKVSGLATSNKSRRVKIKTHEPVGLVSMGHLEAPLVTLFEQMGIQVVRPPVLTDDLAESGKQLAPEFVCYPMVTLLGQMRKLASQGVKRILMIQGKGRCRLGWYAQVMEALLQRAGNDVRVQSLDSPFPLKHNWSSFVSDYKEITGDPGAMKALKALGLAVRKLQVLDEAMDAVRHLRAYERQRGLGDRLFEILNRDMLEAQSFKAVRQVYKKFRVAVNDAPVEETDPVLIALVGEIYVVNEPFVNKNVEKVLGSLEQRVRVFNNLGAFNWLAYRVFSTPKAVFEHRKVTKAAYPYMDLEVGGHGLESVGETILAQSSGLDGALHLFPFTCMPEIIAQNVLVKVSNDLDFPVLSLMISEQTAIQGFITRLEAFCDLLAGRKKIYGLPGKHKSWQMLTNG